ncbi:MAG TPA: pilus assembly protein TadG-related protein [Sphingobium sp.]
MAALRRNRRANVSLLFGFAIIPLTAATGMGIDYARAMRLQTRLNVAADAAALAAVSKLEMSASTSAARTAAYNMFVAQAQPYVTNGTLTMTFTDTSQLTVTVADTTSVNNLSRNTTVSYVGKSPNIFGKLLGLSTLTVKGSSGSTASTAPNIDFYVMIDTSPSMLLPATSAGLTQMTSLNGGCAFACHITGSTSDNYQVARNYGIVLRTDLVTTAVQDLTATAQNVAGQNNTTYRMGLSDFDYMFRPIWPTSASNGYYLDSSLSTVGTHVSDAAVLTYCANNYRLCNVNDNDTATSFTAGLTGVNGLMPAPGTGTTTSGDTPQEVLFIITDGMRDELSGSSRIMGPVPSSLCTTIKNRGIRIAVLNTQYLPESASDSWSISNVKTPYLSPTDYISPALQSCASPGLFYQVTTNGNISAALSALFQAVVSTARLTS